MNTAVAGGAVRRRKPKNPWAGRIVQAVIALLIIGLVVLAVKAVMSGHKTKKPVPDVVQLKLLTPPPPPPPPPPPKVEPKPETPKVEQQAPTPTPQAPTPKVDSPPALAADSSGPGDLAGKAGGTPYEGPATAIGNGGGGNGDVPQYTAVIVREMRRALLADERLRTTMHKKVRVSVQVAADGRIERVTVLDGEKPEVDRLLERRMTAVGRISSPPPDGHAGVYEINIEPVRY